MYTQRFLLVCCCCVLGPVLLGASAWYTLRWFQDSYSPEKAVGVVAEKCDGLENLSEVWRYIQCNFLRFLRATAAPKQFVKDAVSLVGTSTKSALCEIGLLWYDEYESHSENSEVQPEIPTEEPPEVVREVLLEGSSGKQTDDSKSSLRIALESFITNTGYFGETLTGSWEILYSRMRQKQTDVILSLSGWVMIACVWFFVPTLHRACLKPNNRRSQEQRSDLSTCTTSEPDPGREDLISDLNRMGEEWVDWDQTETKKLFVGTLPSSTESEDIPACSSNTGETSDDSSSPCTGSEDIPACSSNTGETSADASPSSTGSQIFLSYSSCTEENSVDCRPSFTGSENITTCSSDIIVGATPPFAGSGTLPSCSLGVDKVSYCASSSPTGSIVVPLASPNAREAFVGSPSSSIRSDEIKVWSSERVLPALSSPSFEVLRNEHRSTMVETDIQQDISERIEVVADVNMGENTPFAWTFRIPDNGNETELQESSPFSNIELPSQPSPQAINIIQGFYTDSTCTFEASSDEMRETHVQHQFGFTGTEYRIPSPWLRMPAFKFDDIHIWRPPETTTGTNESGILNPVNSFEAPQSENRDMSNSIADEYFAAMPFNFVGYCDSFFDSPNGTSRTERRDVNFVDHFDQIDGCHYQNFSADEQYAFPTNHNSGRQAGETGDLAINNGGTLASHPASPDNVVENRSTSYPYFDAFPQNSKPGMPTTYTDSIFGATQTVDTEDYRRAQQPPIIPLEDFEPYFGAVSNVYSGDSDNAQPQTTQDSDPHFGSLPDLCLADDSLDVPAGMWSTSDFPPFVFSTNSPVVFDYAGNHLEEPISSAPFADGTRSNIIQHDDNSSTEAEYCKALSPAPQYFDGAEANCNLDLDSEMNQACASKAERKQRPVEIPMNLDYIYESCDNGKLVPVKDFTRIMEISYLGIEERKDIVKKQYTIAREKCCLDWIESIRNRGKRILPKWWLQKYMKADGLESNKCRKRREWLERKQAEALEAERLKEMEGLQTEGDENRTFLSIPEATEADRLLFQYSEDGFPLFDIQEYFSRCLVENEGMFPVPGDRSGQTAPFEAAKPTGDGLNHAADQGTEMSPARNNNSNLNGVSTVDMYMHQFSDIHPGNCASGEPQPTGNDRQSGILYSADVKECRQAEIEKEDGSGDSLHEM